MPDPDESVTAMESIQPTGLVLRAVLPSATDHKAAPLQCS